MHFAWCPHQEWGNKYILLGVLTRNGGTNAFSLVSLPRKGEQTHFAWCPCQERGNKCILLAVPAKKGGTNAFCLVPLPSMGKQMHFARCPYQESGNKGLLLGVLTIMGEEMHFAWCRYQEWRNKCILLGALTKDAGTNAFCLLSLPKMGQQMHFAWCPCQEWGNKCILLGVLTKNGGTNAFCLVRTEIASTIPPVDPSCVDLKHSAFLAQLLLEEVDLESTSEPASPVRKPVLHMQPMHTGEPVARIADALARPASNNMPLSEHDTQELRRLLYLKAEGIERQERLQYLRQTWKSSIWSEEDDDSYTLPDPEIPLVYSLHYGQQCSPEWDEGFVPAETADRQKKKEHGKSNLHAEEDFLQKLESLNLDPRLKKLLITYEEVFGALPPPLSCRKLVQMDLKLKPEFQKTRVRRRPYPAPQEQVEEIERQIQECIDAGLPEEYKKGDCPHHCSPCFLVAKPGSTALRLVVYYGEVNKKTQNHSGSIPNMENTLERIAKCRYKTKMDKRSGFWQVDLTAAAQELLAYP